MFKNYLKIAFRNLLKFKSFSLINIISLAVGMTCTILIFLWVQDELSFDRFNGKVNDIYGVYTQSDTDGLSHIIIPYPIGPALKDKFPEVVDSTRIRFRSGSIKYKQNVYNEKKFCWTDHSIFDVFSFPFIKGDPKTALTEPFSAVITQDIAKKYFGEEDPINKIIKYNNWKDFKVTGIIKNVPKNSHLQFDFLVSYPPNKGLGVINEYPWLSAYCYTYLLLQENISIEKFKQKIVGFLNDHVPSNKTSIKLLGLKKIHLSSLYGDGKTIYVYIFTLIGILILVIACINFINLSTAHYTVRFKEVGLRKTIGANRKQIIIQFFSESTLFTFISFIISMILLELILPYFNNFTNKHVVLNFIHSEYILSLIFILIFTAIVAGSYPAIFLSSLQPVKILRGDRSPGSKNSLFRNILVIAQFSISIILIIITGVIYSQLNYIQDVDKGFNMENLICFPLNADIKSKYELMKSELSKNPYILSSTLSRALPSSIYLDAGKLDWEGKPPDKELRFMFSVVDFDYISTLKMEMIQGRNFSKKFPTDDQNYILNQEAIKQMELESPIGKKFTMWGYQGKIIGVVKDFHYNHFRTKIKPIVLTLHDFGYSYLIIKIKSQNQAQTIGSLKNLWSNFSPEFPFEYFFIDENFSNQYGDERQMGKIFNFFALMAIFISCMGLGGLVSFSVGHRTKEIGIRKILGASISGILFLITRKFLKLVFIANIISFPIAWYAIRYWLGSFAYKIDIGFDMFILAGVLSLLISLLTVSYQVIRVAMANPIEALRYE